MKNKGNGRYTLEQLTDFLQKYDSGHHTTNRDVVNYYRSFVDKNTKYTNCSGCIKRYIRELKDISNGSTRG